MTWRGPQLVALARPWPAADVKAPPPGMFGDYVPHYIAEQKLLAVVGAYSFEVVNLIRGEGNRVEGCTARLTCEIDGRTVQVCEVGDCEQPANFKTDGGRAKNAASDAFKRCCMRLGLGLHLYVKTDEGERYFLHAALEAGLAKTNGSQDAEGTEEEAGGEPFLFDGSQAER